MKVSTFGASFRDVDARLIADASELRLEGEAGVESISIADPPEFREHVVRGADFFDADNHPEILFRSERVDLTENGAATVEGESTIGVDFEFLSGLDDLPHETTVRVHEGQPLTTEAPRTSTRRALRRAVPSSAARSSPERNQRPRRHR